ncbi:hypothetical protein SADUNF_Sadunf07G0010200 [Salix dunnii]|uniref:RING-type E3 ubiquitin transferase n=1 Tax=Salix dunnii TaxID=1413687 RepID=A0A835MVE1_9ROSI|nr:hypothetical protein SADUNF_Sadunf07G0010200 [Salix dunnii]
MMLLGMIYKMDSRTRSGNLGNGNPIQCPSFFLHVTFPRILFTPHPPASSPSDEKLKVLRKYEQGKINKLLSKYIAFCGKMKKFARKTDILQAGSTEPDVAEDAVYTMVSEVTKNQHIAADEFSYELEAIEEWLNIGRGTSPMTNLRLKNKFPTPNHTPRSLIQEWNGRKSTAF